MSMDIDRPQLTSLLEDNIHNEQYINALRLVADGSRGDITIREELQQPQYIEKLLRNIKEQLDIPYQIDLESQTLRCLGNAIANNPDAVQSLSKLDVSWSHRYLDIQAPETLQDLAWKVLYNACSTEIDSDEDAKDGNTFCKACLEADVHFDLIALLAREESLSNDTEGASMLELLFTIVLSSDNKAQHNNELSPTALAWLLRDNNQYVATADPYDVAQLFETSTTLLSPKPVLQQIITAGVTDRVFKMLISLDARLNSSLTATASDPSDDLKPQASKAVWLLSDLSAQPSFGLAQALHDPFLQSLIQYVSQTSPESVSDRIMTASCIMLGNTFMNLSEHGLQHEEVSLNLSTTILKLLSDERCTPDLLHAAIGLLMTISRISLPVREEVLNQNEALPALNNLTRHSVKEIRDEAFELVKVLGRESPSNQAKLGPLIESLRVQSINTGHAIEE